MKWRADIDGLRAVAVWVVILAHAKISVFEGGYIGVDIFFVISGYLITQILLRELEASNFSVIQFYERRIRRIFPALFFMLLIVTGISWFVLLPVDFKEYGESLAATSVFLSNGYFNIKSGYFANSAELRPLLHTWSLGVEEQFYIVFPIICAVIIKWFKTNLKLVLITCWIISFIFSSNLILDIPDQQRFYLPWFRAWEFLTGSLLALGVGKAILKKLPSEFAMICGLLFIFIPVFTYTKTTPFPGLTALPPVLGAALIILAGSTNKQPITAKLLTFSSIRYMGKISYSLYLWHWPPLVFVFYLAGGESNWLANAVAVLLALLLASASYYFIETPFRNKHFISKPVIFATATMLMVMSLAFGVTTRIGEGLPWRLPPEVAKVSQVALDINPLRNKCDRKSPAQIAAGEICRIGDSDAGVSYAVVGDSFADAFIPGFNAAGISQGASGYVYTYSGCYPLIGTLQGGGKCHDFYTAALDRIVNDNNIEKVFLVARWSSAIEASRVGFNTRSDMYLTDEIEKTESLEVTRRVFERGMRRVLELLQSKKIIVVAMIPEQETNIPRALGVATLVGNEIEIGLSRAAYDTRKQHTRTILQSLGSDYNFTLIDVGEVMCDEHLCRAIENNVPLYVDDNHISRNTAIKLQGLFDLNDEKQ